MVKDNVTDTVELNHALPIAPGPCKVTSAKISEDALLFYIYEKCQIIKGVGGQDPSK